MIRFFLKQTLYLISFFCVLTVIYSPAAVAQVDGTIPQEIKWLSVASLQHWFSNGGAEIEYGRRGRGQYLTIDQIDGLGWPAEYGNKVYTNVGNSFWMGTTNFADPVSGVTYPYKVVSSGRRFMYMGTEIFPERLELIGNREHPTVMVDDSRSSDLDFDDNLDDVDATLPADRMILNTFNTPIGVTVTRKVYSFTQQFNDNYFIYEFTFKNTGIINDRGTTIPARTLTDVVFFWQHRYALACEAYRNNWALNGTNWGKNTVIDAVGQNPGQPNWDGSPYEFRATWAWYGPHSASSSFTAGVGFPRSTDGSIMAGTQYAGLVVLHADKSASDKSDDPTQPRTTAFNGADQGGFAQTNNQYDPNLMSSKYALMTGGHPPQTWAEILGRRYADQVTVDAGGYQAAQGFGPYTLAPGDSVKIVFAEAVSGISREKNKEVTRKWFNNTGPFVLPDGTTTTDRDVYKEAWVFSGKDSLFQTFRRALSNYNSNFSIPQPPPPPNDFKVVSGGNKITLTWAANAESDPNFDGYEIFRAEGRTDTLWEKIFTCNKNNVVNTFADRNARRGFNYFYYIVSKDNGQHPADPILNIPANVPLVSSKFYTMTNKEAFLTRPSGSSLSEIRVVPNPYNIKARDYQFGQDTPDRLAFYGLPSSCIIKIFTETGDLIETINHSGSGDELWHSLTSSRQLVVSGLYIAYFEVDQDIYDDSGVLTFRKGENAIRKFIVIR